MKKILERLLGSGRTEKNYGSHYSVAKSGKKLLIFKAGNSNQDKFKTLKAPRRHIFQGASKKTFELTS